jgi:hypothetical protein
VETIIEFALMTCVFVASCLFLYSVFFDKAGINDAWEAVVFCGILLLVFRSSKREAK